MKRLLVTATAIATFAIPALSFAQGNQDQNENRPERAAPEQTRPPVNHAAQPPRPGTVPPQQYHGAPGTQYKPGVERNTTTVQRNTTVERNTTVRVVQSPSWNHGNPNWWRGRPEFRGYAGVRPGYWYRPGFGYYQVNPRWYGYSWRIGGYVPVEFRGYYVQSPYLFGLPAAPYGFAYVYLANNIALMSMDTGLIVQVFPNVY